MGMAASGPAPEPEVTLEQACARSICRTETKEMQLRTEDGGTLLVKTDLYPYADGGKVSIFSGETFTVEFPDSDTVGEPRFTKLEDRLDESRGLSFAPPGTRPTLTLELKQDEDGAGMRLVAKSTLGRIVKFDATMYVPTANGLQSGHTSTCPVIAGGGAYEMWPHPISMLLLTNFRVLPKETPNLACQ
jgi:hypothetical protein